MATPEFDEKTMGEAQYIDELPKVSQTFRPLQYDAQEEKKALRKVDFHLITM